MTVHATMQAANKAAAAAGPLESLRAPVLYIQHAWWPSSCLTVIQYVESSGWQPLPFLRALYPLPWSSSVHHVNGLQPLMIYEHLLR
jgi:hypothetical protein